MAVQKSKNTRSKRGMRRSHDHLFLPNSISIDINSGEIHLRHHVTSSGFYRGIKIINKK